LDANQTVVWDCIKRHNSEVVVPKEKGVVQANVIGDQIIIDVWETNPGETWTPKHRKWVYQYSGLGWYEGIFENDEIKNNFIGQSSFSTTKGGQAQYREFNPRLHDWAAKMPLYKDGNPTLFESLFVNLIWPIIETVGSIVSLPFSWGPGLLVDLLFMSVDLVIESIPKLGGAAQGIEQFFCADFAELSNLQPNDVVYHRDNTGQWTDIVPYSSSDWIQHA
jgi:hypothetical protein